MSTTIDQIFALIAEKHLFIETLETRNSDRLDFHDVSVYRVQDRKLLVVPHEAEIVRRIFRDFADTHCTTDMVRAFIAEGIVSKRGKPFSKQALYKVLHNRAYIGEMVHKDKSYPGQHDAILDKAVWDAVHAVLGQDANEKKSRTLTRNSPPALLRGLLFSPSGSRMTPSAATKRTGGGKRYLYYIDSNRVSYGKGPDTFRSISADQIGSVASPDRRADCQWQGTGRVVIRVFCAQAAAL